MLGPLISSPPARTFWRQWWFKARVELVVWGIFYAIGWALFHDALAACAWPRWVYLALSGATLLVFSRLAVWTALLGGTACFWIFGLMGLHDLMYAAYYIVFTAGMAIVVRCPLFVWFIAGTLRSASRSTSRPAQWEPAPVSYDPATDERVYPSGRREPAFLRNPYPDEETNDRF